MVLVADDDADDCLLIRDALIDNGLDWEAQFVGDGIELMEYLENCEIQEKKDIGCFPNLIILDLNMPRKGGREALREISVHSRFNKIPIVIPHHVRRTPGHCSLQLSGSEAVHNEAYHVCRMA